MKKICLIIAFGAVSLLMSAQHVSPLTITLAEFSLSSMREQYASDKPMYKSELQRIQLTQDANEKAISAAKKELKEEKAHAKNIASYIEQLRSTYESLQKQYANEESTLSALNESIDKQIRKTQQLGQLDKESRESYTTLLQAQKEDVVRDLENLAYRQKALLKIQEQINKEQASLSNFEIELQNKEIDLNHLDQMHKSNTKVIKEELKAVKASMRN
ncbi:MAG: hypothetical protein ACI30A_01970 [Paludibacteraceae bacterium]